MLAPGEHPEWLIGKPYEVIPTPSVEHAIARGVDYKFPGVRAYYTAIICELFEEYDIDGVELVRLQCGLITSAAYGLFS